MWVKLIYSSKGNNFKGKLEKVQAIVKKFDSFEILEEYLLESEDIVNFEIVKQ